MLTNRLYSSILLAAALVVCCTSCSIPSRSDIPKLNPDTADSLAPVATINMSPLYTKISTKGGQYLADVHDQAITVTNLLTQNNITLQAPNAKSAVMSSCGKLLASSSYTDPISVWHLPNSTPNYLNGAYEPIASMQFSEDTSLMLALDTNKMIYIWDLTSYDLIALYDFRSWPSENRRISSIELSPDNSHFAAISADDIPAIKICDLSEPDNCRTIEWPQSARQFYAVEFNTNWTQLAFISGASAQLFNISTNKLGPLLTHEDAISNWQFTPNGDILAIYTAGTINQHYAALIKLWDTSTGENTQTFMRSKYTPATTINPQGTHLATSSDTGHIHTWNINSGNQEAVYSHTDINTEYLSLAYSPDGKLLAAVDTTGTITLWDTKTHQQLAIRSAPNILPTTLDFSVDGHWINTLTANDEVTIWKPSDNIK